MIRVIAFLFFITSFNASAQPKTSSFLKKFLSKKQSSILDSVIQNPNIFRCQFCLQRLTRDKSNLPHFKNYYFNVDPDLYFNPASMVKMPLAFLALEKLNELKISGVDKYTAMKFDSSHPSQKALLADSTALNKLPSIAHFIKRAFLISENDPYNRLYQFVGQQQINQPSLKKGYKNARITRRFYRV